MPSSFSVADDLPHAPVDLLDGVGVQPDGVATVELLRGEERDVHHRVGQVDEEGPVLVGPDELDRLLGVAAGDRVLVGGPLDLLLVADDGHVVVGRGRPASARPPAPRPGGPASPGPCPCRWSRGCPSRSRSPGGWAGTAADGPGATCRRPRRRSRPRRRASAMVTSLVREPAAGVGEEHASRAGHAAADRVAAGEQGRPAGRADVGGHVELGPPLSLGGQLVEVRGLGTRDARRRPGRRSPCRRQRSPRSWASRPSAPRPRLRGCAPTQEPQGRQPDRKTSDVLIHDASPLRPVAGAIIYGSEDRRGVVPVGLVVSLPRPRRAGPR